jgi:gliding motility-associated-like protein
MTVFLTRRAERGYTSIKEYIAKEFGDKTAETFTKKADETFKLLEDFPQMGSVENNNILPTTRQNTVSIYNRWGDRVFSVSNYNNVDRAFSGLSDAGNKLPTGTYFYKIEFASGRKPATGYISLKY